MAAPSYTTELTSQEIFTDSTGGGWTLISSGGGGQNSLNDPETDDYVQGSNCASRSPWSNAARGMVYTSAQTIAAGDAVWVWTKADVSQTLDTLSPADADGAGIQVAIGSSTNAIDYYYMDGSDTYILGGWKCYVVDPAITADAGNRGGTTSTFGVRWNVPGSGPSKGAPFKIDAMRVGRNFNITDGDLANGYATFTGLSSVSNSLTNQWGCFIFANGVYAMQGLMQLGLSGTPVDFRDSNKVIFVANTIKVSSTFNGIEVNDVSSRVDWTNISISALGTNSPGYFLANENADININGCNFISMSTFGFLSNSTITENTFRGCGQIDQNQSIMTNNLITNSVATSAVLLDNSGADLGSNFSNNNFVSSGTGHAIEFTSGTEANLVGLTYTGYATTDGSTGNEAIFVNVPSGTFTLNISGGQTPPSIRTAGATVTIVASADITLTGLQANSEVRFYFGTDPSTAVEVAGVENSGTFFSFTHSRNGAGFYVIFAIGYKDIYNEYTFSNTQNDTIVVRQVTDRVYDNP